MSSPSASHESADHLFTQDFTTYQRYSFARHFVAEMHFPLLSVAALTALSAWLMLGRVALVWIIAWVGFAVLANLARELFKVHARARLADLSMHATVLRVYTWSSLVSGLTWAVFFVMYVEKTNVFSQLLGGWMVAGMIGVAVTPLAAHLPAFYTFALPIMGITIWMAWQAGGTEQMILAAVGMVYITVLSRYAHDSHRVHQENVRLRFNNLNLITDLEQRKAEAENALRTKSLFLAGVSHDLKQPIRAIALYTGFLRHSAAQNKIPPPVVAQTASKIDIAVDAIHKQITRLLELSRLESGAMPLQQQAIDLQELLAHQRELIASQAQASGVHLHFAPGKLRYVWADRRMLDSILANLIGNAIKYSNGGRVYVGTRLRTSYPEGQRLCIEVRDDGPGIAPEQLPLLFDAYRRFDDRAASESHGLGLAIVKAQATYLGCGIDVRSKLGGGSTFTLCGLKSAPLDSAQGTHWASPAQS